MEEVRGSIPLSSTDKTAGQSTCGFDRFRTESLKVCHEVCHGSLVDSRWWIAGGPSARAGLRAVADSERLDDFEGGPSPAESFAGVAWVVGGVCDETAERLPQNPALRAGPASIVEVQ